jgi:competence protein ComEC
MHSTSTHGPVVARLFFPALLGWVLGSAAQLQQQALFSTSIYACLVLLALVVMILATASSITINMRILFILLAFGLAGCGVTGLRACVFQAGALDSELEGRDVSVTGIVAAMPHFNEAGLRFRLDLESAQLANREVRLPATIYLAWYSGYFGESGAGMSGQLQSQPAAIVAGERWQMTVRLKAPHGASNPFGFDYELWLWEQGLQATGYVRAGPRDPPPLRLAQTGWHPVERWRQRVRDRIFERVGERQYAGLIAALVVGDQNAIDRADWDIFRATGVAHLMSISGLHITMFAWISGLALAWLWRRSTTLCLWLPAASAALFGGVLLALAYAFFSGWGVPSQRTVLMLATVALLRFSGKLWPWPQVLLLACSVVVASDPWALLQAGFWLSFVAVGVLFATDSATPPGKDQSKPASALAYLLAMFHEQWVITLALTPLTLLLFGQVSVVGLAANALAIPWVTLLVTPLAMLGVLLDPLWDLAALTLAALTWYLKLLAGLPFAVLSVAQAPFWAGSVGVLGGLLLAMQLPWPLRLLGLPLMLPVLLWQPERPAEGQFQLLAADVGQGNAVIVSTASHALAYDAGPRFSRESDAGHRVLVPLLRALDISLDMVMLSHRDSDHTGGALALLMMQSKAQLLSSINDDHELQAVRRTQRCLAGQRWRWDGVDFEVLHPRAQDYQMATKSNALSCTLRISNGLQTALLAGDIEQAQEERLVARVSDTVSLKANVLLVPHHGSKSSSSAAFLDTVQPQIALVQAGYRNRFGHPADAVLVRFQERQIRVIDSPHCGAATWNSVQAQDIECQRDLGLRYWHHRVP